MERAHDASVVEVMGIEEETIEHVRNILYGESKQVGSHQYIKTE